MDQEDENEEAKIVVIKKEVKTKGRGGPTAEDAISWVKDFGLDLNKVPFFEFIAVRWELFCNFCKSYYPFGLLLIVSFLWQF